MGCAESLDAQTPNNNIQAETKPNTVKPVAKKQALKKLQLRPLKSWMILWKILKIFSQQGMKILIKELQCAIIVGMIISKMSNFRTKMILTSKSFCSNPAETKEG